MTLPEQPKNTHYQALIDPLCNMAIAAGEKIMEFYRSGTHKTALKADNSPVTEADIAAHNIIVQELLRITPEIPIVSEENAQFPDISNSPLYWLVDPLDGTKSFIRRSDEFTVNIALMENNEPLFGVIYVPAKSILYYGSEEYGAYRQLPNDAPRRIYARSQPEEGAAVVVSVSHITAETEAFLQTVQIQSRVAASSSLKFCRIAEGVADIYPRFGPTCEWDTAAGHALVKAAGGRVLGVDGSRFIYGKQPQF
ncbi:MAG: 3'(2'),5'-bisphosphate nucleotidase CysQ, partial [Alphaproteobacteria bacterium]|nr:3'(2'),5'-bisphosphate nucleotidase CysQ [Alphaproteobacteria bacterium]